VSQKTVTTLHCKYVTLYLVSLLRSQCRILASHWDPGRSKSLKMASINGSYTTWLLLVRHCNYSSILHHSRIIWRWIGPSLTLEWHHIIDRTRSYSSSIIVGRILYLIQNEANYGTARKTALPFNLHDNLEPFGQFVLKFWKKFQVHNLLDGANILSKSSSVWLGRNNVTERQTDLLRHKANVTFA